MNNFYILEPEATTNIVSNPSFELSGTGSNAVGGSVARSSAEQYFGAYSIAVTPTSATTGGMYAGTYTVTNGQTYTFSVYVKGVLGVPYRIFIASTGATAQGTPTTFTGTGNWQRVVQTGTVGVTSVRLYVVKNSSSSTGVFYVDGFQLENKAYETSYCDGDQEGCSWTGVYHSSQSSRDAQARSGGRAIYLGTYDAVVTDVSGIGAPPIENKILSYGNTDGGQFQRQIVKPRSFTIGLSVNGDDVADWDQNLDNLWDLVKPDLVFPQQPFVLGYDAGTNPIRIKAVIDGDFSLQNDKLKEISAVALRATAPDPFWYTEKNGGTTLTTGTQTSSSWNGIYRRSAAGWEALSTGCSDIVYDVAYDGYNGYTYVVGSFATSGGVSTNAIARWDGSAFNTVGSPAGANLGGNVYAAAVAPDGTLYVCGTATTYGGVAANRIAKWNGSAWSALGTGLSGTGESVVVGPDGSVYVTGNFSTAGGVTVNHVAKWNGSTWSALGSGTVGVAGGTGRDLKFGPDGCLYVAGTFTSAGGTTCNGIAKFDGTTWSALGTGLSAAAYAIDFGPDGALYAVGDFSTAGGISLGTVAKWNGSSWSTMNFPFTSTDGVVRDIAIDPNGDIYVVGNFAATTERSGILQSAALCRGGVWAPLDILGTGNGTIFYIKQLYSVNCCNGYVYFGHQNMINTAYGYAATTTTVTNSASSAGYPTLVFTGPTTGTGEIRSIRNETTGKQIFMDITIQAGERIFINTQPDQKSIVSSWRGNITREIRAPSQFQSLNLVPGTNKISVFAPITVGATGSVSCSIYWQNRYWSIHGGSR